MTRPFIAHTFTSTALRFLAVLAVFVSACGSPKPADERPAKPVLLGEVVARDVEERIAATGELLPKHRAEVAAQVAGEVTRILFDEGDMVPAGSVVLEIDPERRQLELAQSRAQLAEATAALRQAERELNRMTELASRAITSKSESERAQMAVDTGRSRVDAAAAMVGVAERAVRDASVTTRFDGVVARRFVSAGEFVQPGQRLFELVALSPIEVELHVPESDAGRVQLGQVLIVTVAPYPGEAFPATVSVVSPTIDPRTRTLRVKALLDNPDGRLRPGHFARADLGISKRAGVLMIPEEALLQRADGSVVFRVGKDQRAERLVVEAGIIRDGWVEITRGLQVGDRIVLRGHANLIDGAVILARQADGRSAALESAAGSGEAP
jgi:membrane fusion protein (multidrug efflux system)